MARRDGSRLNLVWPNKDRRLLSHGADTYEWVDASDWRVSEVRLLDEVAQIGDSPGGNLLIQGDALHALTSLTKLPEYAALTIATDTAGGYSPDFYVLATDGTHHLIEMKADNQVASPVVQAKKKAAEDWCRTVTDEGGHGTWRYVLIPESVMATAKTFAAVIRQAGS